MDIIENYTAGEILHERIGESWVEMMASAIEAIGQDRAEDYGPAGPMLQHIADMWNAYLKTDIIKPMHVPFMMVLFKMARESYKHKKDNLADMVGYVGVAEMARSFLEDIND